MIPLWRRTRVRVILLGVVAAVLMPAVAEAQWYRTYDEGVQAAGKGDWATVEAKMQAAVDEAAKDGVKPGRNVRTFGMRFINFVPDYYLGLAYLNTGRAEQAREALQRVEQGKVLTTRDKEYAVLTQSITQANAALAASATPLPSPSQTATGSSAGTTTTTAVSQAVQQSPVADVAQQVEQAARAQGEFERLVKGAQASFAARNYQEALASARAARATELGNASADALVAQITRAMSDQLLRDAQAALTGGRFAEASTAATNARELGVDAVRADALLREIDVERLLQSAVSSRSAGQLAAARAAATEARDKASAPGFAAAGRFDPQINQLLVLVSAEEAYTAAMAKADGAGAQAALERLRQLDPRNARLTAYARAVGELVSGDVQRLALRQFFAGNYQQVVTLLTPLAGGTDAPPRARFYLACSQVAMLLSQGRTDAEALRPARDQFNRVRAQLGALAADRRFVSPRILELLEGGPTSS